MKTKEELNALKEEVEAVSRKLHELTEEELEQVSGGSGPREEHFFLLECCIICGYINRRVSIMSKHAGEGFCFKCNKHVKFYYLNKERYNSRFGK